MTITHHPKDGPQPPAPALDPLTIQARAPLFFQAVADRGLHLYNFDVSHVAADRPGGFDVEVSALFCEDERKVEAYIRASSDTISVTMQATGGELLTHARAVRHLPAVAHTFAALLGAEPTVTKVALPPVKVSYNPTVPDEASRLASAKVVADQAGQRVVANQIALNEPVTFSNADNTHVRCWVWRLIDKPEGSKTSIDNPTMSTCTITPDLPGAYVIDLQVNDGRESRQRSRYLIRDKVDTNDERHRSAIAKLQKELDDQKTLNAELRKEISGLQRRNRELDENNGRLGSAFNNVREALGMARGAGLLDVERGAKTLVADLAKLQDERDSAVKILNWPPTEDLSQGLIGFARVAMQQVKEQLPRVRQERNDAQTEVFNLRGQLDHKKAELDRAERRHLERVNDLHAQMNSRAETSARDLAAARQEAAEAKRLLAQTHSDAAAMRELLINWYKYDQPGAPLPHILGNILRDIDKGGAHWMRVTLDATSGSRWMSVEEMLGDLAYRLESTCKASAEKDVAAEAAVAEMASKLKAAQDEHQNTLAELQETQDDRDRLHVELEESRKLVAGLRSDLGNMTDSRNAYLEDRDNLGVTLKHVREQLDDMTKREAALRMACGRLVEWECPLNYEGVRAMVARVDAFGVMHLLAAAFPKGHVPEDDRRRDGRFFRWKFVHLNGTVEHGPWTRGPAEAVRGAWQHHSEQPGHADKIAALTKENDDLRREVELAKNREGERGTFTLIRKERLEYLERRTAVVRDLTQRLALAPDPDVDQLLAVFTEATAKNDRQHAAIVGLAERLGIDNMTVVSQVHDALDKALRKLDWFHGLWGRLSNTKTAPVIGAPLTGKRYLFIDQDTLRMLVRKFGLPDSSLEPSGIVDEMGPFSRLLSDFRKLADELIEAGRTWRRWGVEHLKSNGQRAELLELNLYDDSARRSAAESDAFMQEALGKLLPRRAE